MAKKFAFLFPGQGAQYPGMGKDFYDTFSVARDTFEEADQLLGAPFSQLIFEGPAAELTLTKNSQIAIYINSMAILRTLQEQFPDLKPTVCAGLSLGEYSAIAASGRLSFEDCLFLVKARAEYMHAECEQNAGSMSVVLGLEPEVVEQVLVELKQPVWVANLNCPGQVVIAGTKEALVLAAEALKAKGAKRTLPLEVSGAFHSGLMRQAQEKLALKISEVDFKDSSIELVMNVPGHYVTKLADIRHNLIQQVASPVRWEKGIRAMMQNGIESYQEIGCGKTLQGMNKRIGVSEPTFSLEKISDLEEFSKIMESAYATP